MYCPVVRCLGCISDVYTCEGESNEPDHRETVNRKALVRYSISDARWPRNSILRDFYRGRCGKKEKPGRQADSSVSEKERLPNAVTGQETYLREMAQISHHSDKLRIMDDGTSPYITKYTQSRSGYKGRLYAQGVGLSKAPKRIRKVAGGGLGIRDWDVETAYFTFDPQVVEKLQIQIESPYFLLREVTLYIEEKETKWRSIRETGDGPD